MLSSSSIAIKESQAGSFFQEPASFDSFGYDRLDEGCARVTASIPLLNRVATGDQRAVQECLHRYGGLVWTIARRLCPNANDLEDAVQEIFIDLWSNAGKFNAHRSSESTFIAMIARRRLIDRFRKLQREPKTSLLAAEELPCTHANSELETKEEAARVESVLENLSQEQRQILQLSVYSGLSHQQISERLHLPLGTVKSHIRRGLMRLREELQADSDQSGGFSS